MSASIGGAVHRVASMAVEDSPPPGRPKVNSAPLGGSAALAASAPADAGEVANVGAHIFGIGTDICDIRRIRATLERHGERFAQKILSDAEMAIWRARSARWPERGVRYLATRFSAKEAFSKAIGLGMTMPMTWRACEIGNLPSGQPRIVLHGALKAWFEARGLRAHITLSDETDYATSFCILERIGQ